VRELGTLQAPSHHDATVVCKLVCRFDGVNNQRAKYLLAFRLPVLETLLMYEAHLDRAAAVCGEPRELGDALSAACLQGARPRGCNLRAEAW